MKRTPKKLCSLILVFCMVATMLPVFTISADAAVGGAQGDMTALDIDSSLAPEGYDPNTTDNPYGRNNTTIADVDELLVIGNNGTTGEFSKLYGNDKALGGTVTNFLNSDIDEDWFKKRVLPYQGQVLVEGNFTTDNNGQRKQFAYVGLREAVHDRTLDFAFGALNPLRNTPDINYDYMKQYQVTNGAYGNLHDLKETKEDPDHTGEYIYKYSFKNEYLATEYTKIGVGDFDGDGIDEIAVYIPERGNPRIEIWKLQKQDGTSYESKDNWKLAMAYPLTQYKADTAVLGAGSTLDMKVGDPLVPNMVSLTANDFNKDGVDDLAVSWGYFGPALEGVQPGYATMLFGGKNGGMLIKRESIPLTTSKDKIYRASFTSGDVDGDGQDELVLGGSLETQTSNSRYVAIYEWDGNNKKFVVSQAKNFDIFEKDSQGNRIHPAVVRSEEKFYSLPLAPANVVVGRFNGPAKPMNIYVDSIVISLGDNGMEISRMLDYQMRTNDSTYYAEWGVRAADFTGSGTESFVTVKADIAITGGWDPKQGGALLKAISSKITSSTNYLKTIYIENGGLKITDLLASTDGKKGTAFCLPNTDNDTTQLSYTGKHYFSYSDPKVLAVLASPPYFKDLDNGELSGQTMESSTGYGKSKSTGTGSMYSNTLSLGLYTTWEKDVTLFGVTLFSTEAELAINNSMTWETLETSTIEQNVEYQSLSGQDTVVFFSVPMETYVYEAKTPVIINGQPTGDYDTQTMTVNIPHEASVKNMPVETYNRIAADYDGLPMIDSSVLSHTMGMPATYPKTTAGFGSATKSLPKLTSTGNASSVGVGASAQSKEIVMTSETEKSFTYELEIDTKFGVGGGGIKAGITAGYAHGAGSIDITTSGNSFTSTMQSLPKEADPYGYNFNWRLFAYPHAHGRDVFPVVTYLVTDVTQPPLLPINFEQIEDGSGEKQIALTWEHSGNPQSFKLYRYFQSTSAAGYYPVKTIDAGDADYIIETDGATRTYRYIDEGLSPNTKYEYRIQTIGNGQPSASIPSATLTAYTTPANVNMPTVSVDKETLTVYPDTPATVTATVNNMTGNGAKNHMWQKQNKNGTWKDLNVTSDTLRITDAGLDDAGVYRCKVAVFIDQNLVSAYSPTVTVEYQKREAVLSDLTVSNGKASVSATGEGTQSIPSGVVTFTLSASGYTKEYTAALNAVGKAEVNLSAVNGVYKVSAAYGGNRIFRTAAIDGNDGESVFFISGTVSETFYDYNRTYTYGDDLNITKYTFAGGKVTAAPVNLSGLDFNTVFIQPVKASATSNVSDKITYTPSAMESLSSITSNVTHNGYYVGLTEPTGEEKVYLLTHNILKRFQIGKAGWVGDVKLSIDGEDITFHVNPAPITLAMKQNALHSVPDTLSVSELGYSISNNGKIYDYTAEASLDIIGNTKFGENPTSSFGANGGLRFILHDAVNTWIKGWDWDDGTKRWTQNGNYKGLIPGLYTVAVEQYIHTDRPALMPQYCYDITSETKTLAITGDTYTVTYRPDNNARGKVELVKPTDGRDRYPVGTELVFVATAYDGYEMDRWSVNGEFLQNNSTSRLTLTQTAQGTAVTAFFKTKQNILTYTALPANPTVNGTAVKNIITSTVGSGNVVTAGAPLTFTATAASGWHFVGWEYFPEGGQTQYGSESSYTLTMPNTSVRLYAKFERDSYRLTLGEGLSATDAKGNILDTSKSIVGDTEITVKPSPGMVATAGAVWTVDDTATTSTGATAYTFTLTKPSKVSLPVSAGTYRVAATADNTDHGTVSVAVTGVSNPDLDSIAGGKRVTVTATPKRGYVFEKWTVDGSEVSNNSAYTFALAKDTTITAVFKEADFRYIRILPAHPQLITSAKGTISATANGLELKTSMSSDLVSTPENSEKVYSGEVVTITATPNSGYMVSGWSKFNSFSPSYSNTLVVSYDDLSNTGGASIYPEFVAISTGKLNFAIESVTTDEEYTATLTVTDANNKSITSGGNMVNQSALTFTANFAVNAGKTINAPNNIAPRLVTKWGITYTDSEEEIVLNEAGKPFVGNVLTIPGLAGSAMVTAYYENRDALDGYEVTADSGIDINIAEPFFTRSQNPDTDEITYAVVDGFAIAGTTVTFTVHKDNSFSTVKVDGSTGSGLDVDGITFTGFDMVEQSGNDYICTIWAISGNLDISTIEKGTEPPQGTKPTISTGTLPNGTVGTDYNQTLAASGDTPITWSVETGTLPGGLILAGNTISGTPTTSGTYSFTVRATNSAGTDDKVLTLTVAADSSGVTTYALTVSGGTGDGSYAPGATVTITANAAPSDQRFKEWTITPTVTFASGTGKNSQAAKFIMPAGAVTATANYEAIPADTVSVTGVSLNQPALSLFSNTTPNTAILTATVTPSDSTNKAVTWVSSNTAVATVDQSGNVKAIGNGTAVITATTANGSYTATCTVTVTTYSGGSTGGGSIVTQPTIPAANGVVQVNYTASNGTATLSFPTVKLNEIIDKSKDGKTVIDLSKVSGITAASLPKDALTAFAKAGLDVSVKLPVGTVTLDEDAAASVAQQASGSNLTVELKQAVASSLTDEQKKSVKSGDIVLDININSGTKKISTFDGTLAVQMPYTGPQPVALWYLNDKGELEKLDCIFKNGVVSFDLHHLSLYVVGQDTAKPAWVNPFTDMKEADWFYAAVRFCAEKGITNGTSATTFSPDATLTRGQFITMLLKAYGIEPDTNPADNFTDAGNTYYTGYLAAAKAKGISNGVGDNKFAPEKAITRQEMFTLLYNALKVLNKLPTADNGKTLEGFTDSGDVATWAIEAMTVLVKSGTVSGSGGKLDPTGGSTRAQMAQVLYNLLGK